VSDRFRRVWCAALLHACTRSVLCVPALASKHERHPLAATVCTCRLFGARTRTPRLCTTVVVASSRRSPAHCCWTEPSINTLPAPRAQPLDTLDAPWQSSRARRPASKTPARGSRALHPPLYPLPHTAAPTKRRLRWTFTRSAGNETAHTACHGATLQPTCAAEWVAVAWRSAGAITTSRMGCLQVTAATTTRAGAQRPEWPAHTEQQTGWRHAVISTQQSLRKSTQHAHTQGSGNTPRTPRTHTARSSLCAPPAHRRHTPAFTCWAQAAPCGRVCSPCAC
jgi:hypothetical protein